LPGFVYFIVISSLSCLLINSYPSSAFIGGIAWGVSLVLGGNFLTRKKLGILFGLNILLLYGLTGSSSLFILLVFGIPSFIIGLLLSLKKGYYELQKWGMVSAVVLVTLFMSLAYYNTGNGLIPNLQYEIDNYVQESVNLSEDTGFLKFYEQQGISQEDMKENIAIVAHWMVVHLPAFYYIYTILAVYIILSLSSYISRKKNLSILARRPFREEIMPWQFTWVIIIALSLWLWGRDEMMNIYYVGSNLLVITSLITMYYGLSCIAYRWEKMNPKRKGLALILFIITIFVFTLPAIIFVGLLGLFDSLLDYRKLNHKKEETR